MILKKKLTCFLINFKIEIKFFVKLENFIETDKVIAIFFEIFVSNLKKSSLKYNKGG